MPFKFLIFIFLFAGIANAGGIESEYQKGIQFYQKGNYQEAAKVLESICEQGYEGESLFYNLGNAYFRSGQIGLAILYYEKAKKSSPSDEDINHNLNFANSKIIDRIETLPRFFIFDWWENILAFFSISGWTYVTYFFYLLILISISVYYFTRSLKVQRLAFYSGVGSFILFIAAVLLLLVNLNRDLNVKYAVIVESEVISKFSPDQNSKDAFIVHEGLKVRAEDSIGDWTKIKLIDGKIGWIRKNNLRVI